MVKESEAEALKQLTGEVVSKEEASKNTIAYGILRDHNTSGNMEKLQIKFDKLHLMILRLLELSRQQEHQESRNSRYHMY